MVLSYKTTRYEYQCPELPLPPVQKSALLMTSITPLGKKISLEMFRARNRLVQGLRGCLKIPLYTFFLKYVFNLILDHTLRIVVYKVHFKGSCHKGFQTDCGLFKAANRSRLRLIEPFLFLFTKAFICSTQCKFCESKLFTLRSLSFGENKSKALQFENREK